MSSNFVGALWALLATLMFAMAAAMVKKIGNEYHVIEILVVRQSVLLLVVLPSIIGNFPEILKTKRPGVHATRLTGASIALVAGFAAVTVLPLTTAVVLGFSQVFMVSLLAIFLLGEKFGLQRVFAILIGFVGVLVVIRPGTDGFANIHSLLPILGAFGAALAIVSVRRLTRTESTATLLAYQAIFVGLIAAIPLYWVWKTPDLYGLMMMIGIGFISSIGQWVGVQALRAAEASVVASMEYMKLIHATIIGYLLFSEWPDIYTFLGAAIIISAAIFTMWREARIKSQQAANSGVPN